MAYDVVLTELEKAKSGLVGLFFDDLLNGISRTVDETSVQMNLYGWPAGWRAADTEDQVLWFAGCPDNCFLQDLCKMFILETSTMKIYKYNPIGVDGIVQAAQEIDANNP